MSQEALKILACGAMLLDHIGVIFAPGSLWLRIIGRISFPVFCFLIAEGVAHTQDPGKYGLRLLAGAVAAEAPYDLALYGRIDWEHQSVMLTLLLGFVAAVALRGGFGLWRIGLAAVCVVGAQWLGCSYGAMGVMLILLFSMTRGNRFAPLLQAAGLIILGLDSVKLMGLIPIQSLAVLAMLPILVYNGKKRSSIRAVQWAFYGFYPAHLLVLYWLNAG